MSTKQKPISRRVFLNKSTKTIGGIIAAGTLAGCDNMQTAAVRKNGRIIGANDRVNVAVIGIHGMGQSHINHYQKLKNVRVAALCDVDENLFAKRLKKHFTDTGLLAPKNSLRK